MDINDDIALVPGENKYYRVVGIDVAPGKKSTICFINNKDQITFQELDQHHLFIQLNQLRQHSLKQAKHPLLVTWDAPLTGPPISTLKNKKEYQNGDFTQREIETFFNRENGWKTPDGISVMNYSSCQHWTITKALTGLPIMGPFCCWHKLPFHHIHSSHCSLKNNNIIEVHPALAMYIWLDKRKTKNWKYKNLNQTDAKEKSKELYNDLIKEIGNYGQTDEIDSPDKLDAWIAWLLGFQYITNQVSVQILGDNDTGSFLLPYVEELRTRFDSFRS